MNISCADTFFVLTSPVSQHMALGINCNECAWYRNKPSRKLVVQEVFMINATTSIENNGTFTGFENNSLNEVIWYIEWL